MTTVREQQRRLDDLLNQFFFSTAPLLPSKRIEYPVNVSLAWSRPPWVGIPLIDDSTFDNVIDKLIQHLQFVANKNDLLQSMLSDIQIRPRLEQALSSATFNYNTATSYYPLITVDDQITGGYFGLWLRFDFDIVPADLALLSWPLVLLPEFANLQPSNPSLSIYNQKHLFKQWVWWILNEKPMVVSKPNDTINVRVDLILRRYDARGKLVLERLLGSSLQLTLPYRFEVLLAKQSPFLLFTPMNSKLSEASLEHAAEMFREAIGHNFPHARKIAVQKSHAVEKYFGITTEKFVNWLKALL